LKGVAEGNVAQGAAFDQFGGFLEISAGALHGAGLDDAVVFTGGFDHAAAFFDVDAGGLFDVDVLAGFASLDGHVGVPMIRGGNADGVDGLVGQDFAEILHGFGLKAAAARGPHGLKYSLTLHGPDGSRLIGFDNAHPVRESRGPGGKKPRPS